MIDTDKYETDHPELVEFEGETLGDTLTNLITEVKRLRMMEKYHQQALKNARQLMKDAIREAINTRFSHKCPTCDELDIWFEDFVTEEEVKQFFIDRQNPKSMYYVGEKND